MTTHLGPWKGSPEKMVYHLSEVTYQVVPEGTVQPRWRTFPEAVLDHVLPVDHVLPQTTCCTFSLKTHRRINASSAEDANVPNALRLSGRSRPWQELTQMVPYQGFPCYTTNEFKRGIEGYVGELLSTLPVSTPSLNELKQQQQCGEHCLLLRAFTGKDWLTPHYLRINPKKFWPHKESITEADAVQMQG